jgi:hypothetical protein
MSFNHPSAYLPGGSPASTPLLQHRERKIPKNQDYHATIPLNPSTLSNKDFHYPM